MLYGVRQHSAATRWSRLAPGRPAHASRRAPARLRPAPTPLGWLADWLAGPENHEKPEIPEIPEIFVKIIKNCEKFKKVKIDIFRNFDFLRH